MTNKFGLTFALLLLTAILLSGCQAKEKPGPHIGGGIATSPEEYYRQVKEIYSEYREFKTFEDAAEFAGFKFRVPKSEKTGKVFKILVDPKGKVVTVLFEDYPPYGMYLTVIKKPKKPDYKKIVEETNEGIRKGKILVFSPPKYVVISGRDGKGEEPSLQGDKKDFPVAGFVMWWDSGLEYILFGKADGKSPSTTLDELVKIAESCYW